MIAGHALLAFALGAALARRWRPPRDALAVGAVAGAFALVPDVDMAFSLLAILHVANGAAPLDAFWDAGLLAHREVTHSLVLGPVVALAALRVTGRGTWERGAGALALATLAAWIWVAAGPVAGVATLLYVGAAAGVALVGRRYVDHRALLGAALVGLLSHPPGDLFTGTPPHLLYPLGPQLVTERIPLAADPTLNVVGVFGLELAAAWAATAVLASIQGWHLRRLASPLAAIGLVAVVLPAWLPSPASLGDPYAFAGSMLALGAGATVATATAGSRDLPAVPGRVDPRIRAWVTGLTTVTIAGAAFAVAHVAA
jgi:membrane-bound metal-dependent hydrolase YbcI (DUF457 family)